MEQNINIELNWRNAELRDIFFTYFIEDLRFCDSENLEPNPQNIEEYNSTRERCQFILNYYLTMVESIVSEIETTADPPPREIVSNILQFLDQIIENPIFEGIVDQRTEELTEEIGEGVVNPMLQLVNPMLQGNNQEWSELSLVNHYNKLYDYRTRLIVYLNREHNTDSVGGRRRKKYRKSKKAKKSRRVNKKTRRIRKQKSRKLKK
jgi:hypothetical protein